MKVEFTDYDYGSDITLIPETVEEVAALLNMAKNASSKKPDVYLSFYNKVYCSVNISKRKPSVQQNSIRPL